MITSKFKTIIPIILITLCGFGLRLYQIDSNPPSLNWDEVSHGYNAFSILKTGRDEWGEKFPLIFRAFGDYKLPVYIYLTVIPVALLGLNILSVRLISILAGSLAIPSIYFLTNKLFPKYIFESKLLNLNLGHLCALMLSLLPWHFFISRPALEANLALTFIIVGFALLFKAFNSPKYYLPASILLGLSLHTYNTARVFVPCLLVVWILLFRSKIKVGRSLILSTIIFCLGLGLIFYQIQTGSGTARYSKLSILSESAVYQIGQDRVNSQLPPPIAKLIHNRPVYFIGQFVPKYLSYFSPNFFWQSIGANYQFAIPNVNIITIPINGLLIIGLIFIFSKIRESNNKFVLSWFFLSPLAASLTVDYPHALRASVIIPSIVIIATLGWQLIIRKFRRLGFFTILGLVIIFFGRYLSVYYHEYRLNYSDSWQYGYKDAIEYINQHASNYSHVFMTKRIGEPHLFYAFYSKLDPKEIWPGEKNIRYRQSDWYWTDKVNNIYFINDWDIPQGISAESLPLESGTEVDTSNSLLVTSPNQVPANTTVLKEINYLNGTKAFIIARFNEK
jgi:4-amino-4-deoxy-L-arabinose transferase-like glycosyltransferase